MQVFGEGITFYYGAFIGAFEVLGYLAISGLLIGVYGEGIILYYGDF